LAVDEKAMMSWLDLFYNNIYESAGPILVIVNKLLPEELACLFNHNNIIWLHGYNFANGRCNLIHSINRNGTQKLIDLALNLITLDRSYPRQQPRFPLVVPDEDVGYDSRDRYTNVPSMVIRRIMEIHDEFKRRYQDPQQIYDVNYNIPFLQGIEVWEALKKDPDDCWGFMPMNPITCKHGNKFQIQEFEYEEYDEQYSEIGELIEKHCELARYYDNCADDVHARDPYRLRMRNSAASARAIVQELSQRSKVTVRTGDVIEVDGFKYGPCYCWSTPVRSNRVDEFPTCHIDEHGEVIKEFVLDKMDPLSKKRPTLPNDMDELNRKRSKTVIERSRETDQEFQERVQEGKRRFDERQRLRMDIDRQQQERHERESNYRQRSRSISRSNLRSDGRERSPRNERQTRDRSHTRDRSTTSEQQHRYGDQRNEQRKGEKAAIDLLLNVTMEEAGDNISRPWLQDFTRVRDIHKSGFRSFNWDGRVPLKPYLNKDQWYTAWTLKGKAFHKGRYLFQRENQRFNKHTRREEVLTEYLCRLLYILEQINPQVTRRFINAQNYRYFSLDPTNPQAGPDPSLVSEFGPAEECWYNTARSETNPQQQQQQQQDQQQQQQQDKMEIDDSDLTRLHIPNRKDTDEQPKR
jgi:hypothetical protein